MFNVDYFLRTKPLNRRAIKLMKLIGEEHPREDIQELFLNDYQQCLFMNQAAINPRRPRSYYKKLSRR